MNATERLERTVADAAKAMRELVSGMALCQAYQVSKDACGSCGLPATRYGCCTGIPRCDGCPPAPGDGRDGTSDHYAAPATRRLMRIANSEGR